ncbi:hypothetical protein [Micromonospora costi]|uniref:Uncharacterized protein n=1 Tax=Micromonospora costi TaxID=1530042 RepID=A0A3B0AA52_9ACTN|nr:hypothetical protein [Micromonospora costi]RKN56046.1 hypothetical protein D7193_15965 [Micromonospora costi]
MAQGEAEHGCAQGEPCRPVQHDPQASAKHRRPVGGMPYPADPAGARPVERAEDDVAVPRQRAGDPVVPVEPEDPVGDVGCRSDLPGWAGAHRHGPVRPPQRGSRRERPPRRWC